MSKTGLTPNRLTLADIGSAVDSGRAMLRAAPGASVAYAAIFMVLGLVLLLAIGAFGVSPLALPFAGGFMLVGPILLTGYFELARRIERGENPSLGDALAAFLRSQKDLWLLAILCAFLFLIWITDAGILYSFTIGATDLSYDLAWLTERGADVLAFSLWGTLMGSVLAYMIFTVSAFSVPLIHEHRARLVQAISASVSTVLGNFIVCLLWGIVLGTVIVVSVLVLPLLLLSLPVMSYASFALYQRAFPAEQH